jgi:Fe-S-cluster containining protein
MDMQNRLIVLQKLDRIYEDFVAEYEVACRKRCAVCCTCNVTLTTLEGLLLINQVADEQQKPLFAQIKKSIAQPRFQPTTSINQMAQMCMLGLDIPDESADPAMGDCPLLDQDTCPVYRSRPFACRAMLSTVSCSPGSQAEITPFVLTVNQVFLQYLEAIDVPGFSGNLIDILTFLSNPLQQRKYQTGQIAAIPAGLTKNLQIPVLMIPPEHRERIGPLLQKVRHAIQQGLLEAP